MILGSKGQGHGVYMIENGLLTKNVYVTHLWNFIHVLLMSQGCALLILGSKVMGYLGLKIVQDVPCPFKGFCNSTFCIFDAPFTCLYIKFISLHPFNTLDECHAWFHLYGLRRSVSNGKRAKNPNRKYTNGQKKGYRIVYHISLRNTGT